MKNAMLMVIVVVVASVVAQIPQAGLQAYFPFTDGSLADESPLMRGPLTAVNSPTAAVPCEDRNGTPNAAYNFYPDPFGEGRVSAGACLRINSGLPSGNSARSVCFWINMQDYNDSVTGIVHWGKRPSGNFGVYLHNMNGGFYLCVRGFSQPCSISVSRNIIDSMPEGKWAFVAITYNAGDLKFSFNGNHKISFTVNYTTTDTIGDTLHIGARTRNRGTTRAFIDEVSIYNRALTTTEISQMYQFVSVRPSMKHSTHTLSINRAEKGFNLLGQRHSTITESFSYKAFPKRVEIK